MSAQHLARRWWGAVRAAAPGPTDEAWADRHLLPGERALWVRLTDADRSHAVLVARRFLEAVPDAPRAAVAAALLHDVGKLVSGLGTGERVVATLLGARTVRWRAYHDHEAIGAALLREAGADDLTVALVDPAGVAARHLRDALAAADAV